MMWLGSWSEWDLEYGDSSLATRSMHGLHRIESVSFAELISMNEDAAAIMPKKLTMEEAASILWSPCRWQARSREPT